MIKKLVPATLITLLFLSTNTKAAILDVPSGTVLIGTEAYSLEYVNNDANKDEIGAAIASNTSGIVYVKSFNGDWIDNSSSNTVAEYNVTVASYKDSNGKVTNYNNNLDNNIVTFKDKSLEQVVRNILKEPTKDLLKSDVQKIIKLSDNGGVNDISGIENLTNLQELNIRGNKISDVRPLKGLTKLQYLDLSYNQISDISQLKGLTNLQTLKLDSNKINDISVLKYLTNLQSLDLYSNIINDISPLKGLTNLQSIDLSENQISNSDEQSLKNTLTKCSINY